MNKTLLIIAIIILSVQMEPGNAYAYIDPGTGSYLMQLLIAGILGAAFTVKTFFRRISQKKSIEETSDASKIVDVRDSADNKTVAVGSIQKDTKQP
jgi:hypothetical protein